MVPSAEKNRNVKGSLFKLGLSQNIALYASPTDRNPAFRTSAFQVHLTSFYLSPFKTTQCGCGVVNGESDFCS